MEKSRINNSLRNVKITTFTQIINKILAFVIRTVFIKTLNSEYLGINGLFTNILTMLSFAELGFGTAIIYDMYKPVKNDEKSKIKQLLKFYRKIYYIVAIIIFLLGLLTLPFLKFLVKNISLKENIMLIFILFLINTSVSYLFTYKKSIITAYQQDSEISIISLIIYLLKSLIESIILILFRNYILFLLLEISFTIFENILISRKANKLFPYILEIEKQDLSKKDKRRIFNNVKSLFVYKIGSVIMGGTDNIIMSAMTSISTVGLCSNYTLLTNALNGIIVQSLNSINGSVGNLNAGDDINKKEKIFYRLTFMYFVIYLNLTIFLICLLNPFINFWIGEKYLLNQFIVISLSFSIFIEGLRRPGLSYRETLGLFKYGKITPYIGTFVNIISSIILCKLFGVAGIFIGTSLAQLSSYSWMDPYFIHKIEFKTSFTKYIKVFLNYIFIFFIVIFVYFSINLIPFNFKFSFLIKYTLLFIITNLFVVIIEKKSEEFQYFETLVLKKIKDKIYTRDLFTRD